MEELISMYLRIECDFGRFSTLRGPSGKILRENERNTIIFALFKKQLKILFSFFQDSCLHQSVSVCRVSAVRDPTERSARRFCQEKKN